MRSLSLSRAWEDTREILGRDGRLYVAVALAMVVLPSVINGLLNPRGMGNTNVPLAVSLVSLVASLITLAGQLAVARLALGPSTTVGGAIAHGFRRLPIYFVAALIIVFSLLLLAIPFTLIASALGVPVTRGAAIPQSPTLLALEVIYVAIACFIGVRLILSAPVTSAEPVGPISMLKRTWLLTNGHFWKLFGFVLLFLIAAIVVLLGVGAASGVAVSLALGRPEPLSVSALVLALIQSILSAAFTTLLTVMLTRIYVQVSGNSGQA